MFGLVEWRGAGERCAAEEKRLGGVRFLVAGIRRGDGVRALWSLRAAARALERYGVTQAVFPREFAQYGRFAARGIRPVDVLPLRAAAAAAIVRRAMAQQGIEPGRATAALCAARVTRSYTAAAEALAEDVRYLQLCTARGGWELSQSLRGHFGIAAPVLRAPEGADVVLCFDGAADVSAARGVVLPLYDTALRVTYGDERAEESGGEPEQLLAAWYASLALRAEEICVEKVEWLQSANIGVER